MSQKKDTLRNIYEVDEFVCHVVDEALSHAMVPTGTEFPYGVNEFDKANLKAIAATDVRPLRIESSPVAMKCKATQIVTVEGTNNVMVLGRVLRFHVREDLYRQDLGLVDTVGMHSGLSAVFTTACSARSYIVGIPNGRFSSLPGFGIHILQVGFDLPVSFSCPTSSKRASGDRDFLPSTPAVFFPWFSTDVSSTDRKA